MGARQPGNAAGTARVAERPDKSRTRAAETVEGSNPPLPQHHQNTSSRMELKPQFTARVSAGPRLYYIDAFKDNNGRPFLSISEIPKGNSPVKTRRQRVFVHIEDLDAFGAAVADIIKKIKKDTRPGYVSKMRRLFKKR